MRTRSRDTTSNCTMPWSYFTSSGESGLFNSATYYQLPGSENQTDDDSKSPYEKPCLHTWEKFDRLPCPQIPLLNIPGQLGYVADQLTTNKFGWFLADYGHGPRPGFFPDLTLEHIPLDLKQQALISMLPRVNDGLSFVNFILELKDLRRMTDIRSLERFRVMVRGHRVGSTGNYNLRRKDIASDYLNYEFGWKPFVNDIIAILKALKGLDARVKYLEAHAGRILRRNKVYDLDHDGDTQGGILDVSHATFGGHDTLRVQYELNHSRWEYRPRYHATLIYKYTFPKGVSRIRRKIRSFLDAFGIRWDPSIIWNAVPFSFVVDWFVDVGSFLRSFTSTDLDMEVSVLDFSHSVKYQHVRETRLIQAMLSSGLDISHADAGIDIPILAKRTTSYYERARDVPSLHAITGAIPNLMQASLGGALVIGGEKVRRIWGGRPSRYTE